MLTTVKPLFFRTALGSDCGGELGQLGDGGSSHKPSGCRQGHTPASSSVKWGYGTSEGCHNDR